MPNSSAQPVKNVHNQTTNDGLTPTSGMPQQTMASKFSQGHTQTTLSFSMPYFTSASYTPGSNGWAYVHASGNFQAPYTIVAYTDPIPLPDSSLGILPNHAYQNASWFNAYGQPEAGDFGYETHHNFPLGRNRLTWCPFEPRSSQAWILIT
jgi:hypothetical protein